MTNTTEVHINYTPDAESGVIDPRAAMVRSVQLARAVLSHITLADAARPTPCGEWTIHELAQHLVSVLQRAAAAPSGRDIMAMPLLADVSIDDLDAAAAEAAESIRTAWLDDAALGLSFAMPWGEVDGAMLLGTYAGETVVHSWDLAAATGLLVNWPESDVAMYLQIAEHAVPADNRGDFVPFGPVVECASDAPAITRLAAWQGREVNAWPSASAAALITG